MIKVIWNSAKVIAGMIRALSPPAVRNPVVHQPRSTTSPRPKVGSQRSQTPNTRISRIPIRKVGSDTPISDKVMNSLERKPSRWRPV